MTIPTAPTWAEFETAAPELAATGRRTFQRDGIDQALLATVAGPGLPRLHPIWFAIRDGRLLAFINLSPKQADLASDGRYALHSHVGPGDLDEFSLRGRAREITDPVDRAAVAADWPFAAGPDYRLFEFTIASALLGQRRDADEWPPRYTSWKASESSGAATTADGVPDALSAGTPR